MFQRSLLFAGAAGTVILASLLFSYVPPQSKLGSVIGVSGSVDANQYNTIADQLKRKELALAQRQTQTNEQRPENTSGQDKLLTIIIFGGSGMFVLVFLNFYLDYRRAVKKRATNQ
ncbi:hypothetical protein A3C91_03465 [Candidatus Azambacteria bacterium RIFCSPHIGHO2_02_FULL_52_12]|uniref:Uncharacterized protein n=1 Tax=Candidatus Azambacteria bacterium RIFCSPLOWO2_01_FULL_46_25 TaxID=1797298 RepID=A0A1F5BUS5_9BACT|nr:MAG: hypothetical protein A3C91_03465 [Candidatus Azambacteria bacterium RIFCSPHIGHO2_02_FULL_52_12]OGD34386.1 MAG: hypothetical protein A2988_02560 [Candidatus Azambacteria bacterium RIFCSPLOWO2_01_FULL_46_25]OGD37336.1 MAG: hypothetical protein A2850_01325 [Candidatus Azambacteria bacterium RIFCSPHIGHO2_01_FULL_51_74]